MTAQPAAWNHSFLSEPLITVRSPGRRNRRELTLPEVFAQLAEENAIGDFPRITPHQRHPFHAFLVQLAAIALHRAGETNPHQTADAWRQMLLELVGGDEGAFALVVSDLAKPALLQPAVSEGTIHKWKEVETPDSLDILITAKNHDVKALRATFADPQTWFFALLSLQTMQGFLGAGNYGVAKMNGGFASRPEVGLSPSVQWGPRFVRDVQVLLSQRVKTVAVGYAEDAGHALLWLAPWDGNSSLGLNECDPYFIEVCRRIRLTEEASQIRCYYTSTKCARVDAKERNGVLGDPWIPIDKADAKALTVSYGGFTYDRAQELLWGDQFAKPMTHDLRAGDPEQMLFLARVLVRGQGKTEGFYERIIPVRGKVRKMLGNSAGSAALSAVAKAWVELAGTMRKSVLKPALCTLAQGGPNKINFKDKRVNQDLERFDAAVDQRFFASFFEALEKSGDGFDPLLKVNSTWGEVLLRMGETILNGAMHRMPVKDATRYRAIAAAQRSFYGAAKNQGFPVGQTTTVDQDSVETQPTEEGTP